MRGRLLATASVLVALLLLPACKNSNGHSPVSPSTGINVVQTPAAGGASVDASSVSWACFSRVNGSSGALGAGGCTTSRITFHAVTGAALVAPLAPSGLSATVSGSTVALSWAAPTTGDAPSSYIVQAGSAPGLNDLASFDTGSATTSLAVLGVPAGSYYVRIRGNNSAGVSGPSNEFLVVVAGAAPCGSLSAPTGLIASVTGNSLTLTWSAPTGCAPTSYIIQAGSAPGLSNLANFSTGSTATTFSSSGVGAGTYYLRILSASGGALSAPSTEIVFVVGGCGSSPSAPTNLRSLISGSTVVLVWEAPSGACPPTSYLLQAGSSPGAVNVANTSVSGTSLTATGVAFGVYYIRVVAVNAVGQSAPSSEIAITVGPVAPETLAANFVLFDPASQPGATTECRFRSAQGQATPCSLSSTSTASASTSIVSYAWTVQYTYGAVKTLSQSGSNPTLSLADFCGGPSSTSDGVAQPLSVSLTVTNNLGATATATSGVGSQPALQVRLYTCGS